jgi:hypothetical protein
MINFATSLLDSKQSREAASIGAKNLASSSQKVAAASQIGFAQTLAQVTADPNSSQVISAASGSQSPVAGQISATPPSGLSVLVPPTEPVPSTGAAESAEAASPMATWYASSPADNAYWAQQPAAVQQLRNIQSEPEREQVAAQLASEGYSIDVPVMVWGWDAGITTQLRETAGYTWVPSALQPNVTEAPGVNTPGFAPYNPANPPAGSILVG